MKRIDRGTKSDSWSHIRFEVESPRRLVASRNPAGKTVAELIDDACKDAAAEKTTADNQKRLADEAKVKRHGV